MCERLTRRSSRLTRLPDLSHYHEQLYIMPATVTTNNSGNASKHAPKKLNSKRTRVVRRRGRGGLDSDDEIEREAHTDSDTDENSSVTSVSDSESVSDDEPHTGIVTPSTTQSPPPLDIPGASGSGKPSIVNGAAGPFVGTTDWAQIVADENAHGASDLPVIDFNDMHTHAIPEPTSPPHSRSRKAQKQNKKPAAAARAAAPSPIASPTAPHQPASEQEARIDEGDIQTDEPIASSSRAAPPYELRKRGQSARQAYQERMQADPAFVPRVGEFWGHDDRLLDKDLRSLSGWWRGRWQGRGRGRGFPMRGRGGRFFPGHPLAHERAEGDEAEKGAEEKSEVPPIEKTWGHDGFEEMRRREDQRREDQRHSQPSRQSTGSQRGSAPRGRGSFSARGRGGFARGGGVASSAGGHPRVGLRSDPSSTPVWYIMKPEKVWTKHADNFLYFEPALRPRPGEAPGIRIKLPGNPGGQLVRQKRPQYKADSQGPAPCSESVDGEERQFVVRIPAPAQVEKVVPPSGEKIPEGDAESDIPLEEVFTVRPHAAPEYVPLETPATSQAPEETVPPPARVLSPVMSAQPMPETQRQLEQLGFGASLPDSSSGPSPQIEETLLRHPPNTEMHAPVPQSASSPDSSTRLVPPLLPPLQIPPVPQPSPSYGSPYTYSTLPPGIAMSHQGFPYELATGRPVYLHPTPPPMYAPQPMMQSYMGHPSTSVPFVPGHMHHPSQEYMPHPATPPTGFIDPATGVPIFAPARQNSRIQIRAPSDSRDVQPSKHARGPSGLRESTTEVQVSSQGAPENGAESQEQQQQSSSMDPAAMAYAPYQQPYYYPDPNGYPGYMDMSHQHVQYDAYPPYEQHAQPVIYY